MIVQAPMVKGRRFFGPSLKAAVQFALTATSRLLAHAKIAQIGDHCVGFLASNCVVEAVSARQPQRQQNTNLQGPCCSSAGLLPVIEPGSYPTNAPPIRRIIGSTFYHFCEAQREFVAKMWQLILQGDDLNYRES